ncbi:hypothetical protein CMO92_01000 [Candidatus Woesearchaeota archaeon]|nr:hypothetical protein [Candidatus Woesearchaeota archaeon]
MVVLQELASSITSSNLLATLFKQHPLLTVITLFILLVLAIGLIGFIFDIFSNLVKILLAFAIDILDFLLMIFPFLFAEKIIFIPIIACFLLFILFGGDLSLTTRIIFGTIAAAEIFISIGFPFSNPWIGLLTGILPSTAILMTIAAIID